MLTADAKYPINKRLYEITGNDMYLWLGGHYDELKKIEYGQN